MIYKTFEVENTIINWAHVKHVVLVSSDQIDIEYEKFTKVVTGIDATAMYQNIRNFLRDRRTTNLKIK